MKLKDLKFRARIDQKRLYQIYHIDFNNGSVGISREGTPEFVRLSDIELFQFTGKKDIDGVDIYDGDILEMWTVRPSVPTDTEENSRKWRTVVSFINSGWVGLIIPPWVDFSNSTPVDDSGQRAAERVLESISRASASQKWLDDLNKLEYQKLLHLGYATIFDDRESEYKTCVRVIGNKFNLQVIV